MITQLKERLHGEARLQIALAQMDGHQIDKKVCRYNELIETAIRYGLCDTTFREAVVFAGLREAIDCCVVGDPMHIPKGSCRALVPDWMLINQQSEGMIPCPSST